jgi:hypothetical protein
MVITGTDADADLLLFLSKGAFRIAGQHSLLTTKL